MLTWFLGLYNSRFWWVEMAPGTEIIINSIDKRADSDRETKYNVTPVRLVFYWMLYFTPVWDRCDPSLNALGFFLSRC